MDDGSKTKSGYKLATNCFTLIEIYQLCLLLKEKFNLNVNIHKNGPKNGNIIYIKAESAINFKKIILPYIHNSMKYKFLKEISFKPKNIIYS
jgi:hypothetical protein